MKPLLHRRTFWKGVAFGAAAMAALIIGSVVAVSLAAPKELNQGVRPTWEPTPSYASRSKPDHITLPPCDTRGKDCVVFDPFTAKHNTVPEPNTLWLIGLAGMVMARNTLFATATAVFVTLGRWLGMKEADE